MTATDHTGPLLTFKKGTSTAHAALARQLQLLGCSGVVRAEADGFLRFGQVDPDTPDEQTFWGIVDPGVPGRVSEIRVLNTRPFEGIAEETVEAAERIRSRALRPLTDEQGREVEWARRGRLDWPLGADTAKLGDSVALVCGAENLLAAGKYWYSCPDLSVACMLEPRSIAVDALKHFAGRDVLLADMGDPATARAYALWRIQLAKVAAKVTIIDCNGWRFADGRRATSLWDWCRIQYEEAMLTTERRR